MNSQLLNERLPAKCTVQTHMYNYTKFNKDWMHTFLVITWICLWSRLHYQRTAFRKMQVKLHRGRESKRKNNFERNESISRTTIQLVRFTVAEFDKLNYWQASLYCDCCCTKHSLCKVWEHSSWTMLLKDSPIRTISEIVKASGLISSLWRSQHK